MADEPSNDSSSAFPTLADSASIQDTLAQYKDVPVRTQLDIPRPTAGSGVWSALRAAIGKDLSRIAMPVQFNEPVSFTQRLVEDLEYSELLDKAAAEEDSFKRLAYVTAFANAIFASSAPGIRVYKAFNPLLGETYELCRPADGWRVLVEQVSHHPPVTALHAESERGWIYRQHYSCDIKFRGNLRLDPKGPATVEFANGDRYAWVKPATVVHNIFLGRLWVEQVTPVTVTNLRTKHAAEVLWRSYSTAGSDYMNLTAYLKDPQGQTRHTMHGRWDQGLVLLSGDIPLKKLPSGAAALKDPAAERIWTANELPASHKPYYGMTTFAMGLNAPLDNICPTDSRLRPDQRLLEDAMRNLHHVQANSRRRRLRNGAWSKSKETRASNALKQMRSGLRDGLSSRTTSS
eukprot:TRINITY_DN6588_c0_g1_i3.p1 TRINITY_DN6588_c0_g1~~TRINITY_DN6588_c0_g1_i3.p1  ORF type:complete len:404 (+),score=73.93 TRINITY_DN6588_c0_g1_i3:136-1347(+)